VHEAGGGRAARDVGSRGRRWALGFFVTMAFRQDSALITQGKEIFNGQGLTAGRRYDACRIARGIRCGCVMLRSQASYRRRPARGEFDDFAEAVRREYPNLTEKEVPSRPRSSAPTRHFTTKRPFMPSLK
jgi:hypothetical protein